MFFAMAKVADALLNTADVAALLLSASAAKDANPPQTRMSHRRESVAEPDRPQKPA
jgi:hypothetical protein